MIFKEEAILIPLLLSLFSEDDWLAIAKDSPEFGYAIIQPDKEWLPSRVKFGAQGESGQLAGAGRGAEAQNEGPAETPAESPTKSVASSASDSASTSAADSTTSPAPKPEAEADLPFGGGYLSLKEANLILNHLPFEITFIDKNDLFKYFNTSLAIENKLFPRVPSAIGRHVKMCHPPRSLDMVMTLIDDLKHKRRTSESMWFHRSDGRFAYVTYIGVFDDQDQYMGVLEYVHDIAPLLDLGPDKRGLAPLEGDGE